MAADKLDSTKYRGDIAPNVPKSAVSKVKKKTSQKHQTKKSVSKVNKIEDGYVKSKTPPKSQWPQIIDTIEEYLSPLRPVIFEQCVDAVKKNATFFSSLNKKLTNKIELPIAITQYHLVGRRIQLLKYITPKNGSDFMTMFFDAALKFGSTEERNHYYLRYDIDYLLK